MNSYLESIEKASELEKAGEYFASSFYYKEALQSAIKDNDSVKIKFCKNKIVHVNKESIKSGKDFKEISFEQKINEEDAKKIDEFINRFLLLSDINEVLKKIGNSIAFCPKLKHVKDTANKTMPVSYAFANLSTISNAGHLVAGGDNCDIGWLMKMYDISNKILINLYLTPLFKKLLLKNNGEIEFSLINFIKYFQGSDIIESKNLDIINYGLEAYFSGDYISCLHILIPQFESVFLSLSEKCGIDAVALDQKIGIATRTKNLSDKYLSSDEFIKIWGEDLCFQIKFVLFEPLGYKLRHKIAHGEILKEECNFDNCNLIIYFFLVLLGRLRPVPCKDKI